MKCNKEKLVTRRTCYSIPSFEFLQPRRHSTQYIPPYFNLCFNLSWTIVIRVHLNRFIPIYVSNVQFHGISFHSCKEHSTLNELFVSSFFSCVWDVSFSSFSTWHAYLHRYQEAWWQSRPWQESKQESISKHQYLYWVKKHSIIIKAEDYMYTMNCT